MKSFIGLVFSLLFGHRHVFSIVNKYKEGDIVFWPSLVDSMVEPTLKIVNWTKYYDKDKDKESILYDGIDIYNNKEWAQIDENELQLIATKEEIEEAVDPIAKYKYEHNFTIRKIHLFN